MVTIRNATIDDADRILEIYDYYVRNTAITFEYETPTINEFKERMRTTMMKYPYLVVLKNGIIEGGMPMREHLLIEQLTIGLVR